MTSHRLALALCVSLAAPLASSAPLPSPRQASSTEFELLEVTNGFGQLLPHQIFELGSGGPPGTTVIDIRELDDLLDNLRPGNEVFPPASFSPQAVLPNGSLGNHLIAIAFNDALDIDSVLDSDPSAAANSQLTGAIRITAIDTLTGQVTPLQGRAFVGGWTYAGTATGNPPSLPLQRWFSSAGGNLVPNPAIDNDGNGVADGLGVPGTEPGGAGFGAELLARENVFLFLPDGDGDLTTHETVLANHSILIEVSGAVRSRDGRPLRQEARVTSSSTPGTLHPEVRFAGSTGLPDITPPSAALDVDPLTQVTLGFTETLNLLSLGTLTGAGPASFNGSVRLAFGPANQRTQVPYTVLPAGVYDLTTAVLTPAFPFPGQSPIGLPNCGALHRVDVSVTPGRIADTFGNFNQLGLASFFETGEGPGLVNAPVTPDVVYAGLAPDTAGSGAPALSVIDLNGFGASTGDPTYDPSFQTFQEGWSNYVNNPNLRFQGSLLRPPLVPGNCTVDGGSSGVFTRTRDSNLDPRLARSPVLLDVSDMALGQPLDQSFNNAPAPFGCQSGGGNLCAFGALKSVLVTLGGPSTTRPATPADPILNAGGGVGNTVSWAPHPNPPPLVFPPLCVSPHIGGQEPTAYDSQAQVGLVNLLVPGDPFGAPNQGVPPSGLLSTEQNAWFQGPSLPATSLPQCSPYMIRQQVGHFLYVADRVRREVVVLNSNRMTPIDRIALGDPTSLALSPNLDLLAVTNHGTGRVSFIDVDPASASFHTVVQEIAVGAGPRGIAWDSLNEDLLVCNELDDEVAVISAFSLAVRKVVSLPELVRPFEVVITPRQIDFGSKRKVYYGYVLGRDGRVSIFESGPSSGVLGWGYDDLIGQARYQFRRPKAIQVDATDLRSAVWIAHEGPIDLVTGQAGPAGAAALSRLYADATVQGQVPLLPNTRPQFRELVMRVDASLGSGVLTGIPTDLCFDDLRNLGALRALANPFSAGAPAAFNGKALVRDLGNVVPVNAPRFLFLAVPESADQGGSGAVDVISLASLTRQDTSAFQAGTQSIAMPGVRVLMDYFRQ